MQSDKTLDAESNTANENLPNNPKSNRSVKPPGEMQNEQNEVTKASQKGKDVDRDITHPSSAPKE